MIGMHDTRMYDVLRRYGDGQLSDPERYRLRVREFSPLYERLLNGSPFTKDFAGKWFVALRRIFTNLPYGQEPAVARNMVAVMEAELPCYREVAKQFGVDMRRIYANREQDRNTLTDLLVCAELEKARIRADKGFFGRIGDAEWAEAKMAQEFANSQLNAMWEAENPQPQVIVETRTVYVDRPVYQNMPSYRGF